MSWASAAPICASMAWRGRAAINCSGARSRSGTPIGRRPPLKRGSPGCCGTSIRSVLRGRRAGAAGAARCLSHGEYAPRIEPSTFSLREYLAFCTTIPKVSPISNASARRLRRRNARTGSAKGLNSFEETGPAAPPPEGRPAAPGRAAIAAPVPGSIWQVLVSPRRKRQGRRDDDAPRNRSKMEVRVCRAGLRRHSPAITAEPGQAVRAGQRLGVLVSE